jgi:ribose 5-phosphate isomerase B
MKKIYLASDHAGFELKKKLKDYLEKQPYDFTFTVEDLGTYSAEPVSWAEYGAKAAQKVSEDPENSKGIIICGSGIGMSMVSNKFKNVRAALCNNEYTAEMSRKHNNANVLNMGARVIDWETAIKIVDKWLHTEFEGGRHQKRLDDLRRVEQNSFK